MQPGTRGRRASAPAGAASGSRGLVLPEAGPAVAAVDHLLRHEPVRDEPTVVVGGEDRDQVAAGLVVVFEDELEAVAAVDRTDQPAAALADSIGFRGCYPLLLSTLTAVSVTVADVLRGRAPHKRGSSFLDSLECQKRRPVQGCGSACGSTDWPKAAPARPSHHGFGITQLPPQFLLLQRHRDKLGVIDRSAVIGGDREARHPRRRTYTRRSYAGRASA